MTDGFTSFGLDGTILAGVRDAGYDRPTPIQVQTVPAAMQGRDVLGLAQTGTGKTAAFVLPILQRLSRAAPTGRGRVRAPGVAPTRELAGQINDEVPRPRRPTGPGSAAVHRGGRFPPPGAGPPRGAD